MHPYRLIRMTIPYTLQVSFYTFIFCQICNDFVILTVLYRAFCFNLEPVIQRVREGGVANFSILRAGLGNFVATVMYRFEFGGSSPGDFISLSNDSLLVFGYGEWMKNISVTVQDDDIPETDEVFYIVLFNATGAFTFLHYIPLCVNVVFCFWPELKETFQFQFMLYVPMLAVFVYVGKLNV